jgi:hypothetical protein
MEKKILLSEKEVQEGAWHANTLKMAEHLFLVHGYLNVENLYPKEFVRAIADAYMQQFLFDEELTELKTGTMVSHKRYITPIPLEGAFNDARLYANPLLLALLKQLLGPNLILSSLGAVTSFSGSMDQHPHADYFPLFEGKPEATAYLPPYAITVAVPLIDIDLLNGPTKVWPGSHHVYPVEMSMSSYEKHLVCGPIGSCYLWDYRTFHAGGSNHSDAARPLLYMAYTRRWFHDFLNPDRLEISAKECEKIPKEFSTLFPNTRFQTASV